MMTIRPKLITFDVTGTLLKFRMPVGQQYAKVGSSFGLKADPDLLQKNFKIFYKQMIKDHPNFGQVTGLGWESWWKQLVTLTFKNSLLGIDIDTSKMDDISSRLIDVYKTSEGWELESGAVELLDFLKVRNIHLGVISNYDSRLEGILKDLKIMKYFNFIVASYEVKFQKPDKNIFKFVEQMNNNLKPNEVLHVGDSVELDFLGAQNAGWNAILIHKDIGSLKKMYPKIDINYVVKDLLHLQTNLLANLV